MFWDQVIWCFIKVVLQGDVFFWSWVRVRSCGGVFCEAVWVGWCVSTGLGGVVCCLGLGGVVCVLGLGGTWGSCGAVGRGVGIKASRSKIAPTASCQRTLWPLLGNASAPASSSPSQDSVPSAAPAAPWEPSPDQLSSTVAKK